MRAQLKKERNVERAQPDNLNIFQFFAQDMLPLEIDPGREEFLEGIAGDFAGPIFEELLIEAEREAERAQENVDMGELALVGPAENPKCEEREEVPQISPRVIQKEAEKRRLNALPLKERGNVLYEAASAENLACINLLLEDSENEAKMEFLNLRNPWGRTAVHAAASNGVVSVLECLHAQGADFNVRSTENNWNPVDYAIFNNQVSAVIWLYRKGILATLNLKDTGGLVQHWLARKGFSDILKFFIEQGVGLSIVDRNGGTPLYEAAANGHLACLRVMVENSSERNLLVDYSNPKTSRKLTKAEFINSCNKYGRTATHAAASTGQVFILEYLHVQGADFNLKCTENNWNPVDYAIFNNQVSAVIWLYRKGMQATLNLKDTSGLVQHWLARKGFSDILKFFIEQGVGLTIVDRNGGNPLYEAAENGHLACVRVMVENSSERNLLTDYSNPKTSRKLTKVEFINSCNKYGRTAVHAAASNGKISVLEYLHSQGCDLSVKCKALQWSPLDYALENKQQETAIWLANKLRINLLQYETQAQKKAKKTAAEMQEIKQLLGNYLHQEKGGRLVCRGPVSLSGTWNLYEAGSIDYATAKTRIMEGLREIHEQAIREEKARILEAQRLYESANQNSFFHSSREGGDRGGSPFGGFGDRASRGFGGGFGDGGTNSRCDPSDRSCRAGKW